MASADGGEAFSEPGQEQTDLGDLASTFGAVAGTYLQPLRHFAAELRTGRVATERIRSLLPPLETVTESAQTMGLEGLFRCFQSLGNLLRGVLESGAKGVDGSTRQAVLQAWDALAKTLPGACDPDTGGDRMAAVLLRTLLRQLPGIGAQSLDQILGAGITSPDMLAETTPQELNEVTGIDPHLCECSVRLAAEYLAEKAQRRRWATPAEWLRALEPQLALLDRLHREAESARGGAGTDHRRLRRERQRAALQIEMILAEMGQARLVEDLQRQRFGLRIEKLRKFTATLRKASRGEVIRKHKAGQGLQHLDLRDQQLEAISLVGADLAGSDLTGANLAGADLRKTILIHACLREAFLVGANLSGAQLRHADSEGANLSHATLVDAELSCANLEASNLEGARLDRSCLFRARLADASLGKARLVQVDLREADLTEADTAGASFEQADLSGAVLNGTALEKARSRSADPCNAGVKATPTEGHSPTAGKEPQIEAACLESNRAGTPQKEGRVPSSAPSCAPRRSVLATSASGTACGHRDAKNTRRSSRSWPRLAAFFAAALGFIAMLPNWQPTDPYEKSEPVVVGHSGRDPIANAEPLPASEAGAGRPRQLPEVPHPEKRAQESDVTSAPARPDALARSQREEPASSWAEAQTPADRAGQGPVRPKGSARDLATLTEPAGAEPSAAPQPGALAPPRATPSASTETKASAPPQAKASASSRVVSKSSAQNRPAAPNRAEGSASQWVVPSVLADEPKPSKRSRPEPAVGPLADAPAPHQAGPTARISASSVLDPAADVRRGAAATLGPRPVRFADGNLEQCVRDALGRPAGRITEADVAGLTRLDCSTPNAGQPNVTKLEGIESLVNLVRLDLSFNQVTDIGPLTDLHRLESLNLRANRIVDIGPLAEFPRRCDIDLWQNPIQDITPLLLRSKDRKTP